MSDAPTLAVDTLDLAAAQAAGWSMADVEWEVKCERAALLAEEGRPDEAAALWREVLELARANFSEDDPRLGTSLANAALALRDRGDKAAAATLFSQAARIWDASPQWIAEVALEARARSSLFHLRMEARHRDKYDATMRERLTRFAEETRDRLGEFLTSCRESHHGGDYGVPFEPIDPYEEVTGTWAPPRGTSTSTE